MPAGRPRSFDIEEALDRALEVFWRKGFEGASLPELTAAMGINRPSLYAAFGNKEALFKRAIDRYAEGPARKLGEALPAPTAREVARRWLASSIELVTGRGKPRGCLIVQAALACGTESESVRAELVRRRCESEAALRRRFERALNEGDLPADADPAVLAKFISAVSHGMAVLASGGAGSAQLKKVAELAMRAWPS